MTQEARPDARFSDPRLGAIPTMRFANEEAMSLKVREVAQIAQRQMVDEIPLPQREKNNREVKELFEICEGIASVGKSIEEWRQIESSDMFQVEHYCGGFEADEDAFWFSFYDEEGSEYYFKLTLENISDVLSD